jgi:hypothetical protein
MRTLIRFMMILLACAPQSLWARSLFSADIQKRLYDVDDPPYATIAVHNVGKIALTVSNMGVFGLSRLGHLMDPVTGLPAPSLSYPKGYEVEYLYEAALWVGAIVGRDTLVSTGSDGEYWGVNEFWPLPYPEGDIKYRSIVDPFAPEYDSAVSQQDFIAVYTDTIDDVAITNYDDYSGRAHIPLGIQVTQRSYAWAYSYAEDFVFIDFQIANIKLRRLNDVYIGFYVDNDCGRVTTNYYGGDDVCGFKSSLPSRYIGGLVDTLNIVWAADNDGDPSPITGQFHGLTSPTSAVAVKVLRTPVDKPKFNFNWWVSSWDEDQDWGPRRIVPNGRVRQFHGVLGTPHGDNNKYYMMASNEFDYDQRTAYLNRSSEGWLPPPENAMQIASGADIRYLISCGPFDIGPGEILPFTIAIVCGQNFHRGFNFTDLQLNTLWATWIYDNPGVDTDGDGYKGKYYIYCMNPKISRIDTLLIGPADTLFDTVRTCTWSDTVYYEGDGIPDFNGAAPPPAPQIRLYPRIDEYNRGEITIRWNGLLSETFPDQFSQKADFEGYRVYISRSGRTNDFTMVTSYDVENYDRHEYDKNQKLWVINNPPYDMRMLRQMYGDDFDPTPFFDENHLFSFYNNSVFEWEYYYFTRHDWNESDYRDPDKIHRVYPDQPYPSTMSLDTARMFYPGEVTELGELKYFEYEYTLKNLLPSIPYYIAVTAFDHGYPPGNLPPLETNPAKTAVKEYAQNSSELVMELGLNVVVYPNPYRIDGHYRDYYEGWEHPDWPAERTQALHFANLPNKCKIRIFSIDGDLIDEIVHDFAPGQPGSSHDTWDMISRNEMKITSGIYYFSVESELGNQIGKFVVIY